MLRCNMITKSLHYVSTKARNLSHYVGLNDVNLFLDQSEKEVSEEHQFQALDIML